MSEKILLGIKEALQTGGKVTINLSEASALTGSGSGVGGRTYFDDVFAKVRTLNPFRMGSMNIKTPNVSAVQFVAKTGNAADATNPWGYTVNPNTGSPNTATTYWQMPTRVLSAQLPVRLAALDDVNGLGNELIEDLVMEFSALEGASMAINDDQSGSSTTSTGGTEGLRGLDSYVSAGASAFGTSGAAITNGIHSIATVNLSNPNVTYNNIVDIANALPAQYWAMDNVAWQISPAMIQTLRQLKDNQGMPLFLEMGDMDAAAVGRMFGWAVIPNPHLSTDFPIYLAAWDRFLTIADVEEMNVQMMEQTAPGFMTLYAEKRLASTVRDPFAGVRAAA